MLDQFSYLSTVSGGGYIGAWLWAWRKRAANLATVLGGLAWPDPLSGKTSKSTIDPALSNLCGKTSYLAPRMGLLSSDTWTAVVLYLRNLILNQLILLPLLAALVALPKVIAIGSFWNLGGAEPDGMGPWHAASCCAPDALERLAGSKSPTSTAIYAWALFLVFAAWIAMALQRPAWRLQSPPSRDLPKENDKYKKRISRFAYCGTLLVTLAAISAASQATRYTAPAVVPGSSLPYLLDGFLVAGLAYATSLYWEFHRPADMASTNGVSKRVRGWAGVALLAGAVVGTIGATLGGVLLTDASERTAGIFCRLALGGCLLGAMAGVITDFSIEPPLRKVRWRVVLVWTAAGVSGSGGAAMFWAGAHVAQTADWPITVTFSLAPLWFALSYVLADTIYLGLTARRKPDTRPADPWGDQEREYLARSGGMILFFAGGVTFLCLATLLGPRLWTDRDVVFGMSRQVVAAITAILSFLGSVGLGVSPFAGPSGTDKSSAQPWWLPVDTILALATPVFAFLLISLVSLGLDWLVPSQSGWERGSAGMLLAVGAGLAIVSCVSALFVNINRFSLHDVYRLRLMREFLGASNIDHDAAADGWTGFTATDDVRMNQLWPPPGGKPCLYPLVNATLNLTKTNRLAWQERKGEPFVFTPGFMGSARLGYGDTGGAGGGLLLSSAMTLSGAAVSPNSGYASKPALTLLMTMFNLRLGAWVGAPRKPRQFRSRGPGWALRPLVAELFGRTNERGSAGYFFVSDGGHFDNLGLYEVLRRRCRFIVVSDAGHDPGYAFEDLGRVVRQVAIDLGIRISFLSLNMPPRPKPGGSPADGAVYSALAKIEYPETQPGTDKRQCGWLLYFKPGYQGRDEPADVRAYANQNPAFPHDSTMNQFFGESQFESYRQLGSYTVMRFATKNRIPPGLPLHRVFAKAVTLKRSDSREFLPVGPGCPS